jgi:hypothetical protein
MVMDAPDTFADQDFFLQIRSFILTRLETYQYPLVI